MPDRTPDRTPFRMLLVVLITSRYCIECYFRGVLIFIVFVVDSGVMDFSTDEINYDTYT